MATATPAVAAAKAVTKFRNSGTLHTTDSQFGAHEGTHNAPQRAPVQPTELHVQTAGRVAGTFAQQGIGVPEIGGFSPQDGLQWVEQHWQAGVIVGLPLAMGAAIAKIVHVRVTAATAMESSFQRALTLVGSTDIESQAEAAQELLYLLSTPRSDKYHQRIFALAVDHFRQRQVEHGDQSATNADFKFVPVLVFAAAAIRDSLQRRGANVGATRKDYLNASHIHLDGLSLREADLSYLLLEHATFTGALLSFANFSHADLAGADLTHATLNRTDLSHANLSGANLTGAQARDANLRHALLRKTELAQADLSYAHFEEAALGDDANLQRANIYRATGLTDELRKKYRNLGAIEQD